MLENRVWHAGNCLDEELNDEVFFSKQTITDRKITIPCHVEETNNKQYKYIYRKKPCGFEFQRKVKYAVALPLINRAGGDNQMEKVRGWHKIREVTDQLL